MGGNGREIWSSRIAFIFAAVGAAVGFGNIWRFPALAYSYGGGAFFLPYLLALLLVGIPLLILETAMGQHYQKSDVGVFGSIHERLRSVGLVSVMCGFCVTGYYVPLISWVVRGFVESFGHMADDWENISGSEATEYFFNEVIGMGSLGEDLLPTRLLWRNVIYLLISWICIGGCLAFGIKWTGRIAYFTMGLPIILLFVFFLRAITLEGAWEGIHSYIGEWDFSVLRERPDCWSTAVSQIFFSLGVTFGIMTAFGSHCPRGSPATENSVIIAFSNSFFSFVSGFAVFGALGYLKHYEGAENMDEVVKAGPALLFGAYPAVLSTLPGGLHWVRLLFFNLFLLGIDSAFALTEAAVAVIKDSVIGTSASQRIIVGVAVFVGFCCGLIYTTDAGLIFLDTVDFYINFIMIIIGFYKAFAAGWIYGLDEQITILGKKAVYTFIFTTYGAIIFALLHWFNPYFGTISSGLIAFVIWYGSGMALCTYFLRSATHLNPHSLKSKMYDLYLGNVVKLKAELETSAGKIPFIWTVLIKHFIPPLLLGLFFNLASAKTEGGQPRFGHYEKYAFWPFQVLGVLLVTLGLLVVLVGIVKPSLYAFLEKPGDETKDSDGSDTHSHYTEFNEKNVPEAV